MCGSPVTQKDIDEFKERIRRIQEGKEDQTKIKEWIEKSRSWTDEEDKAYKKAYSEVITKLGTKPDIKIVYSDEPTIGDDYEILPDQLLKRILMKTDKELMQFLIKYLFYPHDGKSAFYSGKQAKVDLNNYIYIKGNIPAMLVAHLDTVHAKVPSEVYINKKDGHLIAKEGIGADDRAGVFSILYVINQGLRPYILFTMGEEHGTVGARVAASKIKLPEEVQFLVEIDRKGSVDAVYYDNDNPEFSKYIESFGFKKDTGTFTDICPLMEAWKISGVNLSSGYYSAHSKKEILRVDELMATTEKIMSILTNLPGKRFIFIEKIYTYTTYGRGTPIGRGKSRRQRKIESGVKPAKFEKVLSAFRYINKNVFKNRVFATFYRTDDMPVFHIEDEKSGKKIEYPISSLLDKTPEKYEKTNGKMGKVPSVTELPEADQLKLRKAVDLIISMSRVKKFYSDFWYYAMKNAKDLWVIKEEPEIEVEEEEEKYIRDVEYDDYNNYSGGAIVSHNNLPIFFYDKQIDKRKSHRVEDVVDACVRQLDKILPMFVVDELNCIYIDDYGNGSEYPLSRIKYTREFKELDARDKFDIEEAVEFILEYLCRDW